MATWPASLPQNLMVEGLRVTQQKNAVRQEMAAGPVFQRRRFSAVSTTVEGAMLLDTTQYDTFWDFYNNTLGGGVTEFDWKHPITGDSVTMQFNVDQVPNAQNVRSGELVRLTLSLEILP